MTATLTPQARHDALSARLAQLRSERDELLAEIAPTASGDHADRATNVDGHVRLAMLEDRILLIEDELSAAPSVRVSDGTVAVGDVVTVDFGDGAETYLLGSVEQAGDGMDVITPASPLGRVLVGAEVGATVSYSPRPGTTLQATVVAIA